jgi:hypothetical protein
MTVSLLTVPDLKRVNALFARLQGGVEKKVCPYIKLHIEVRHDDSFIDRLMGWQGFRTVETEGVPSKQSITAPIEVLTPTVASRLINAATCGVQREV